MLCKSIKTKENAADGAAVMFSFELNAIVVDPRLCVERICLKVEEDLDIRHLDSFPENPTDKDLNKGSVIYSEYCTGITVKCMEENGSVEIQTSMVHGYHVMLIAWKIDDEILGIEFDF